MVQPILESCVSGWNSLKCYAFQSVIQAVVVFRSPRGVYYSISSLEIPCYTVIRKITCKNINRLILLRIVTWLSDVSLWKESATWWPLIYLAGYFAWKIYTGHLSVRTMYSSLWSCLNQLKGVFLGSYRPWKAGRCRFMCFCDTTGCPLWHFKIIQSICFH